VLSLHEFGETVSCDYTTASRLLSGERAPSTALLQRICRAYQLDANAALAALAEDRTGGSKRTPVFAAFLREQVFDASVAYLTSGSTLSGGQEGDKMVVDAGASRPADLGS